jgi:hypothetical protein
MGLIQSHPFAGISSMSKKFLLQAVQKCPDARPPKS